MSAIPKLNHKHAIILKKFSAIKVLDTVEIPITNLNGFV